MDFEKAHAEALEKARARRAQAAEEREAPAELSFRVVSQGGRGAARSARFANKALAWALLALVVLVPVVVGGNRPVVWMSTSMMLAALFLAHSIAIWQARDDRPAVMARKPWLWGGALILVAYAYVQALPVPRWLGIDALFGQSFPSGYISQDADASWIAALRLSSYLLFFFLAQEIARNSARVIQLLYAVAAGVFLHAVWGLAALVMFGDMVLWAEKNAYQGSATGTFVNRNSYATFLAMGAAVLTALSLRSLGRGRGGVVMRLFSPAFLIPAIALAIVIAAVLATASRMGLASAMIGCAVSAALMMVKLGLGGWRGLLVLAGGAGLLLAAFGQSVAERLLFAANEASIRLELYSQTIGMIKESPALGVGIDAFAGAFENHHQPPLSADVIWHLAHNSYLANWVEMGLFFGSLPLLLGLGLAVWLAVRVRRRAQGYTAPVAALGALAAAAAHSLVDFSLEMQGNTFLLLFLLALAAVSKEKSAR